MRKEWRRLLKFNKMEKNKFKEFFATSWSIDNKTSVYVLAIIIAIFGIINYNQIAKEQFPDIVIPKIIVSTIYPGTSPEDMENLITRPLEKNMKAASGVKKITSKSVQDFSMIIVEFNTDVAIPDAKQRVKDAVDKTKSTLPNDLKQDPMVKDIDLSEVPIMNINLSGNFDLPRLKKYAEMLQDKIESYPEITRVDIIGALDREIKIDVDMFKMQAANVSFSDIERAISSENITISGGNISLQNMTRSVRIVGEFSNMDQIKNITLTSGSGAIVRLKDIATIIDGLKKQESFSHFNGKNVVTLNVIKKGGKNLLDASDKIDASIKSLQKTKFPKDLEFGITGDQSERTRSLLKELNNTIIIGFILVTIVLMFFMGLTNALFVGLSVPLSMAIAYIVLPGIGFTMNMLVMFSFIFALGIVVDDAIVVIENTHRIFKKHQPIDIKTAAKMAAGEVFAPILSGTLTTLAPFFPLAFWPGVIGQFMFFIPITLIITLFASLIVAYIFNPVFAVDFMTHDDDVSVVYHRKKVYKIGGIITGIAGLFFIIAGFKMGTGMFGLATFVLFIAISYMGHNLYMYKLLEYFQKRIIPGIMNKYDHLLQWVVKGRNPYRLLWGTFGLLLITVIATMTIGLKVELFPSNQPQNIFVYVKLPIGTDVNYTDSIAKSIEKRVIQSIGENNPDVESIVTNVALGASEDAFDGTTVTSHKAKIAVNFYEWSKRTNSNTTHYMDIMRENLKDIPGVQISVDKAAMGPPTGKAISMELSAENMEELIATSSAFVRYLDSLKIPGAEKFKTDFERTKPEITVNMDRIRANYEGITTGQAGMELRTAILGKEVSKYREDEDQYPIMLRYQTDQRESIDKLMNLKITYRDMNSGLLRAIPLSSVANVSYTNSVGGINRTDLKRVITVYSNPTQGFTPFEVIAKVTKAIPGFKKSENIDIKIAGEQEDQKETMAFMGKAMLLSLFMILFILITQFNSIGKTVIILSEVLFSIIGVLLGFIIFKISFSTIMSGMGIVALAGIVVRNGILLVEFTDTLKAKGMKTRDAIIQGGKTRITPVLLTATATILGLLPLAIGFNIDFANMLTNWNPHIHLGGDNQLFFGPLAWAIIFGLTFATFLTLVLIPAMYSIAYTSKLKLERMRHRNRIRTHEELFGEDALNE